jgi:hypothetical protein
MLQWIAISGVLPQRKPIPLRGNFRKKIDGNQFLITTISDYYTACEICYTPC